MKRNLPAKLIKDAAKYISGVRKKSEEKLSVPSSSERYRSSESIKRIQEIEKAIRRK